MSVGIRRMSRPLSERVKDWKWWGEQVVHFLVGGIIVAFIAFFVAVGGIDPGGWARVSIVAVAVWGGALREIIQNFGDTDGSLGDSIVDMSMWTLGAIIVGGVY